jgi:hypothetical protein
MQLPALFDYQIGISEQRRRRIDPEGIFALGRPLKNRTRFPVRFPIRSPADSIMFTVEMSFSAAC